MVGWSSWADDVDNIVMNCVCVTYVVSAPGVFVELPLDAVYQPLIRFGVEAVTATKGEKREGDC